MSERALRAALAATAAAGLALAAYLTVVHLQGGTPLCLTSGCQTVQRSRYADVLGLPVAALGLGMYGALLASVGTRARHVVAGAAAVALAAVIFSSYLLFIQVEEIHAICSWCVASDALTNVVAVVAVLRLRRVLA